MVSSFLNLYQGVLDLARENPEAIAAIVFALGFAESIPIVSLFVPSTVLFIAIGTLVAQVNGSYAQVVLAGAIGASLADTLTYLVGRYFRHDTRNIWPFTRNPDILPRCQSLFERWGALGVFGSKFLGAIRAFVPLTAGMMDMPWGRFLLASLSSSLIWAALFLAPGFGVSELLKRF